ncbi:uncharacterized protein FOMMEDRAFT_162597 [Fomitiporia mediterranea MF3/22]|uniref:UDP-Glycosyltransferase/glycogen phosphorylase n=1 Tax=Fomitiporia mediterranea (strain MF3/22) TaxID=694068 RepID=R7SGF8_FOMME|nr:uncharacterized protein FOMMEDRAFT_162597 [Fomitiporia mediterranea MF3/22]EJC97778.1 hypothetical protein FOMMEDRAFT_162597 [Fomitiporia mediterranea MF3/22]
MTIDVGSVQGHVIVFTITAWGRAKCAWILLAKIVRYRSVHAAMFIGSSLHVKVVKDLDAQFIPEVENDCDGSKGQLDIPVAAVPLEMRTHPFDNGPLNASFIKEYERLLNSNRSVGDRGFSSDVVEPGSPQLVILDFFLYETLKNIRSVSGITVPVYALQSASVASVLFMFGPPDIGGVYRNVEEELNAILYTDSEASSGGLIEIPGLPPMCDLEHTAQNFITPEAAAAESVQAGVYRCDVAVMNTNSIYEAPSIRAFEGWLSGRPVINVGPVDFPLFPRLETASQTTLEVKAFLDSVLHKFSPARLHWSRDQCLPNSQPPVTQPVVANHQPSDVLGCTSVLEVMIEERAPIIFAHASPSASVPDDKKERYAGILQEIRQRTPQALLVATVHNLGYELVEVRSGDGLRPIHHLGGKAPEASIESVRREFSETRSEDERTGWGCEARERPKVS